MSYDGPDRRSDNGIERTLGNMDATLTGIAKDIRANNDRLDSHSRRIGSAEKSLSWIWGAGTAVGTTFGAVLAWVGFVSKH